MPWKLGWMISQIFLAIENYSYAKYLHYNDKLKGVWGDKAEVNSFHQFGAVSVRRVFIVGFLTRQNA